MLTIRTSKCNTIIRSRPQLFILWLHNPKGWFVGKPEVIRLLSHLPVTQEKSRNSPELLCDLAFGVWNLRLPQFDRISLRVMHAGEPAVGIRLRVNLDLDSCGL
jgi:hypothetical protein